MYITTYGLSGIFAHELMQLVYGDALSGTRDVVAALLRDPLTDTAEAVAAITDRYAAEDGTILRLRYAHRPIASHCPLTRQSRCRDPSRA